MAAPANGAVDDTLHEHEPEEAGEMDSIEIGQNGEPEEAREMDGIEIGQNGDLPLQSQLNGGKDTDLCANDDNGNPQEGRKEDSQME